jgi:hypothetical protein
MILRRWFELKYFRVLCLGERSCIRARNLLRWLFKWNS